MDEAKAIRPPGGSETIAEIAAENAWADCRGNHQEPDAAWERKLRLLQTALGAISDFAYIFDLDGRFVFVNQALLNLWGLTLEEAVGKDFFDLKYPPALAAKLARQIRQVIETRERLVDETPYTSPTGAGGYYEYIFVPILAADGNVELVAGSTHDITDRKRAQTLLDAQRQSLELVVSGKPLIEILTFLARFIEEQSAGGAIASVFLLDEGGCLRMGAAPSLPEEYHRAVDGLKAQADVGTCSAAAATGAVVVTRDIETDPHWKQIKHVIEGYGLKAAWSNPIFDREGRVLGTLGTYFRECRGPTAMEREIVEVLSRTAALAIERSRADQERERLLASERDARAQADSASRAKDKFIAVLSHELRTPLAPVVMMIPEMEADPALPEKFREDLAMVRRNIDLEVRLIDDLLDLSRVSSGKLKLQMQPVRGHDLLRHAIRNGAGEASDKKLTIREEFSAAHDELMADSARLQQVFWNLVRNSVKFTPEGGTITIRTWNSAENDRLHVEVKDTGIGIPADILPRVFDAFEQGDARVTRQFGGLGLGLAIARALVEMQGGTICAQSQGSGFGASFSVSLPLAAQRAPGAMKPSGEAGAKARAAPARILLVEDHADTARVLARILSRWGHAVKTVHDVASALAIAGEETFDIVISDIDLPDASGYELMRGMKIRHGIKGIALSGYGMEEDLRKSREAGFAEHVTKPVDLGSLQGVIDRVMRCGPAGM